MSYTSKQKELYQAIKEEAIEQGETLEEAELTARDYIYYTRREERIKQAIEAGKGDFIDYRGWPACNSPDFK